VGYPYISGIDTDEYIIYISDSGTSTVIGHADYDLTTGYAYVYDELYDRNIGVLVFGSGITSLFMGRVIRVFTADATGFCPTSFIPLNQLGVRGLVLPDGTLVTGDIILAGENGVNITNPGGRLRIDMVGVMKPTQDDCGDQCPVIKQICFHRAVGSIFSISRYSDNALAISTYAFSQDDICANQKDRVLPDSSGNLPDKAKTGDDPCAPHPVPPTPTPDPGEQDECYTMANIDGQLFIAAPSASGYANPVAVQEVEGVFNPRRLIQEHPVDDVSQLDKLVEEFRAPPLSTDGIEIGLKGLRQYKKGTSP
jgi:hypothetical protein